MWGFEGSNVRSMAPVLLSLKRTFFQVLPPSLERNTPRVSLGPYAWPIAATKTMSGFVGWTITLEMCRVSSSPMCVHVLPPSTDLYIPSPYEIFPLQQDSPVPT